jgi:hypothetical protein
LHQKIHRNTLYYPVLLGIYPLLALLASNLDQVRLQAGLRVGALSLAGSALLYLLMRFVVKDWGKAAVLSTWILLLFFSYGHVYGLLENKSLAGFVFGRHRILAPLWGIILFVGVWLILKKLKPTENMHRLLNAISVVLVVLPLLQIGYHQVRAVQIASQQQGSASQKLTATQASQKLPDVYYIILDGYTRADTLQTVYHFDNTPFVNSLKQMGFVLPDCAQSNYSWTALSLSSSFQMNYLQAFNPHIQAPDEHMDYQTYQGFIVHNPVRQSLHDLGYKVVAFETDFPFTEMTDADIYIIGNNNPLEKMQNGRDVSDFELLFLRTTALRILEEAQGAYFNKVVSQVRTPDQVHYDRIQFVLDQLQSIPTLVPERKFVFAHLVAPHAPFVFTPTGKYSTVRSPDTGYPDEIAYLDTRILKIVQTILANSATPPVIVIQGDHGWDAATRMTILNAYYLPGGGSQRLYPTITPVNTFRVIFNQYFGGSYPMLPDKSFYSSDTRQFGFELRPSTCSSSSSK